MIDINDLFEVKGDKVKLTREIINEGRSINGGWSNDQFRCLGIDDPNNAPKGWKKHLLKLCDKGEIWLPLIDVAKFLELKDKHLIKQKNMEGIQARYGKLNKEVIDGKVIYYFKGYEINSLIFTSIRKMYADLNYLYNYSE